MRVNISLPDDLHERVKTWLDGRPLSGLIADLLIGYLDENEQLHGKIAPKKFEYKLPKK
ncbi:MAG: hypothetical protein KGI58_04005 [Patescibacteria group bacterium]|nr:hypothetical protein [Patescibacteria group bacterium]